MSAASENSLIRETSQALDIPIESGWDDVPEDKQQRAINRLPLVRRCVEQTDCAGITLNGAIDNLLLSISTERISNDLIELAYQLGRKGKPVARATLYRWCQDFKKHGVMGLVPGHKGSGRKDYGWEARALHYWQLPSKPAAAAVARWIREEGHESAKDDRVYRYLKSLPADARVRGRIGARLFTNTQKSFIRRTTTSLAVGACYEGDGHTIDVYLQHPNGGNRPWRAEITVWIDVAARYIPGWFISEAESAHSTLFALSHALTSQDHIPAVLHIDNGSGYKNKMMSTKSIGFYARLGMDIMHSRPYNAKGKGIIERWFGTMERDFGKRFPSYCGADMDPEAIDALLKKVKQGEVQLPTLAQYVGLLNDWIESYHNTPHRGLAGKTPAEMWATLEQHTVQPRTAAIFWPRTTRTVQRQAIRLDNREYFAPELLQYNGDKVIAEYSIHDDSFIRVMDEKCRWICDAKLIQKVDYLPTSRIEEAKDKRLKAQIKRLESHADEKRQRAGLAITHDQVLRDLDDAETPALEALNETGANPFGPAPACQPERTDKDEHLDSDTFDYF
ncbi:MAG TPA: transposase [Acidiferrobacteraceae bacterium]|nr:transposase [Acidiferrobacteraceae bacterium]